MTDNGTRWTMHCPAWCTRTPEDHGAWTPGGPSTNHDGTIDFVHGRKGKIADVVLMESVHPDGTWSYDPGPRFGVFIEDMDAATAQVLLADLLDLSAATSPAVRPDGPHPTPDRRV